MATLSSNETKIYLCVYNSYWYYASGTSVDPSKTPPNESGWNPVTEDLTAPYTTDTVVEFELWNHMAAGKYFEISWSESALPTGLSNAKHVVVGYDPALPDQLWDFLIDGDPGFKIQKTTTGDTVTDMADVWLKKVGSSSWEYATSEPGPTSGWTTLSGTELIDGFDTAGPSSPVHVRLVNGLHDSASASVTLTTTLVSSGTSWATSMAFKSGAQWPFTWSIKNTSGDPTSTVTFIVDESSS